MEPLIPTLTFEQLRQAKKNASNTLSSLSIDLSSSTTGNLVASMLGYKDWNTAKALTSENNTQSKKVEFQHLIPSHLGDMSQNLQNYDDRENGTIFITPRSDNNEIDTPHHPALSAPDDMSPSDKSTFLQTVHDCAVSIRLSHLEGIANKEMVDKILEDAVLVTYNRVADKAIFSSLIASLKTLDVPQSVTSLKEEILYLLSGKNPNLPINYYGAVINAGKKRTPKASTIKYDLVEAKESGLFDHIKAKAGYPVTFDEQYLWKATNINFIPSQSSVLYGITGCGKSHLMLEWANTLETDPNGMPYVYLSKRHWNGAVRGTIRVKAPEEIFDWKDQSGIVLVDDDNDDFSTYRGLIQKAMSDGRHIFIDENVFLFDMLDEVIRAGYHNFTIAIQSVRSLFEHNTGDIARYAFERVLIGKQNDVSSIHYFGQMNMAIGMPVVSRIPRGEFYLLNSIEAE